MTASNRQHNPIVSNAVDVNRQPVVGNDIVDLHFGDSPAYEHVGHLERVCTMAESRAVRQSTDPSTDLAVIWASKEATYKALVQRGIDCKFAPREFVTDFEDRERLPFGCKFVVSYCGLQSELKIALTGNWVHAVATHPENCNVRWAVAEIECSVPGRCATNESAVARRIAADLLSASDQNDIVLQFTGRVPTLRRRSGDSAGIGISLSHHGAFAAAALCWLARDQCQRDPGELLSSARRILQE